MGVDVKLIEQNAERCSEIADKLSDTMILNGDGSDLALLREEEAGKMDVVFAVTGQDDKNLLCSLLVKQLGAKKILSRVNRSVYIKLFEMVGVDRAVSPGQVTADAVLQRVIGGEEVITLSDERMELVDFIARPGAKIIGKTISKELPKDSLAGLVMRDGIPLVPAEDFKAGSWRSYLRDVHAAGCLQGEKAICHLMHIFFIARQEGDLAYGRMLSIRGAALFNEDQSISEAVCVASKDPGGFAAGSRSRSGILWRDWRRYRLCLNISSYPGSRHNFGKALQQRRSRALKRVLPLSLWGGWEPPSSGLCLTSSWEPASSTASSSPCPLLPPPAPPYSLNQMPKGTG